MSLRRPTPDEHDPYYGLYIDQAPASNILGSMGTEVERTVALLNDVPEDRTTFRYAPGKWSLREVVGHLIDAEWTFTYRGLCFAREDPTPRPGFDQDQWVRSADAHAVPMADLLASLRAARHASLALFRTFGDAEWARSGLANQVSFTVRCMPYILVGHEIHHRRVISERYLKALAVEPS
ncbi:MAG: DinB family protein [Acidobacteriota bacterium]